jgi:mannose-6-phosphate isomerase-like protein (cupin superfamily)
MANELPPVRRIVTGFAPGGAATIIEDRAAPHTMTVPERPGYRVTSLWVTGETPVKLEAADGTGAHKGLLPPKSGSVVRIIDIPPEPKDKAAMERMQSATFGQIYADHARSGGAQKHPGMHQTDTVDYAVVLEGEITAVLEDKETLMKAGDVLIQRGTNHAWANRSDKMCRILFVLLDGKWE